MHDQTAHLAPPTTEPQTGLARRLTHGQISMIAMGSALGTGLFLGAGTAIGIAGPAVLLSFALGSFIAGCVALCTGEMASRHPVHGGFGTLAARFLGERWGFLVRWLYWFATVAVTGAELVASAIYLQWWFPGLPVGAAVLGLAAILVAVNASSVHSFGAVEFWLSSLKVLAVVIFILAGLFLVFVGTPSAPAPGLDHLTAHGGFAPKGLAAAWVALAVVMFSFGGIELISITAAEAENPAVSVHTAVRTTLVRLVFFYLLSIGVVLCLVPWTATAGSDGSVTASPFVVAFDHIGIPAAATVTNLVVLIAALSSANANLYAGSRMIHSLAVDGLAPRPLERLSARRVPVRGLLVSSVGVLVAALLAFSGYAGVFGYMIALAVFAAVLVWTIILATYLRYHPTRDGSETFRVPGGRVTAVLGLVGLAAVALTVTVAPDLRLAALVGLPAVVVLLVLHRRIGARPAA